MQQRPLRGLALFTVLSLAIAACGGGGTATTAPGTDTAPSVPVTSEPPESEPPASDPGASEPGESEPGGSAAPGDADISGELQIGVKYADADEVATSRYDLFASMYPDVDVTFTEADFDPATFLAAVQAGNPPDVVRLDRAVLGTYVANGALEPLATCISDFGIDMSQYREAAVAAVTMNGEVYGIPESNDSRIILINDSVVEDAGLTPEDIDTSDWEALSEVNQQLLQTDGGEITRIGFDPKLPEFLPLWAAANGTTIISDDGLTSNLDDPLVAAALDYAVSLITAHGDASTFFDFRSNGAGGADFFGAENQFVADTVGAFPMEQWYLNVLGNVSPDESISFMPFKDRQGNNITFGTGSTLVIPASADNKEAACEYIKVVTSPEAWHAAAQTRADIRAESGEAFTGVYTANRVADEQNFAEFVSEESAGAYYPGVQLVLEVVDDAITLPPNAAGEEFTRIWQEAVQRVLNEGVSAQDALADADAEAQRAIDDAQP